MIYTGWLWICFALLASRAAIQLWVCRYELADNYFFGQHFDTWSMRHDEKLIIPDVQDIIRRGNIPLDYKPYPSAPCFGLLGPWLSRLGLRCVKALSECRGTDSFLNRGLRVPFVLVSAVGDALILFSLFSLASPMTAGILFIIWSCNHPMFTLGCHSIIEHLLSLWLLLIIGAHAFIPGGLILHAYAAAIFCAAAIFIKPHAPFVCFGLLFSVMAGDWFSGNIVQIWDMLKTGLVFGAALCIFEGAHCVGLYRQGTLRFRLDNLLYVLMAFTGRNIHNLQQMRPVGLRILGRYPYLFVRLLVPGRASRKGVKRTSEWLSAVGSVVCVAVAATSGSSLLRGLAIFHLLSLGMMVPFMFYIKRAVHMFSVSFLLVSGCLIRLQAFVPWAGWLALAAITSAVLYFHLPQIVQHVAKRSEQVRMNCSRFAEMIVPDAKVYLYCWSFRFFWQTGGAVFISADDQIMDNRILHDYAVLHGDADYVMISGNQPEVITRLQGLYPMLTVFSTGAETSDYPVEHMLFAVSERAQVAGSSATHQR